MKLKIKKIIILCLLIAIPFICFAQKSYIYEFQKNLNETSGQGPILSTLGAEGSFVEENLPELGNAKRTVYKFSKNSGLNYSVKQSNLNLGGNYSIEIYFKFDSLDSWKRVIDFKNRTSDNGAYIFNGKLNFYKLATSDIAPVAAGEYTHYIITYDANSKLVNIYADGIGKISFEDKENDSNIDNKELHFFYDDLIVKNEASAGTVAFIKLYDYVLTPKEASTSFTKLKQTALPHLKNKLTLTIKNANTGEAVNANVTVLNKNTIVHTLKDINTKEIDLDANTYRILVEANGYARAVEEVIFDASATKEIKLMPVKIGESVKLEDVRFKQGLAELIPSSYEVLDALVKLLNDNLTMEIELSGHTDNQGDPAKNILLSEQRVALIKNYLTQKGISDKRIKGKGYGGALPIAANDKEETRKLNRRVDFKITKF